MKINRELKTDYPKNKLEVMKYADDIREITQRDLLLRNYASPYMLDRIDEISSIANKIIRKEYEKVKMPSVFDVWYKHEMNMSMSYPMRLPKITLITDLSSLLYDDMERTPYESLLREWIFEGDEYEHVAYSKCIDAINNGYEVDQDGQ